MVKGMTGGNSGMPSSRSRRGGNGFSKRGGDGGRGKAYERNLGLVSSWLTEVGGDRSLAFARVLVVNNGLSALRLVQGIRALSYEISRGRDSNLIQIVVMASDADWVGDSETDAPRRPEYLKQYGIDIAGLDGSRPADTYQNQKKVMDAARTFQCDAIAVGWGHLAENVTFREMVAEEDLVFIGPPHAAMQRMGDKIVSKILMQAAKVPMLPWSGSPGMKGMDPRALENIESGLFEVRGGPDGSLDPSGLYDDAYRLAGVFSEEDAERIAMEIGYPVVIKATAGGGGRGIRFVNNPDETVEAWRAARSEARAAFNNDVVFIEKAAARGCRHVEEQVLCDIYGNVALLGERECSIQRHHQKLIEESGDDIPISGETRRRIREASLAAAEASGYQSAGTVEFLVDREGNPHFMEMNTRLQVEHIATEALLEGLDLVKEQLKMAMGIPLPLEFQERGLDFSMGGHSISVRILAENPEAGFSPQTGVLRNIDVPSPGPGTPRYYFSHSSGALVNSFADSQIGHAVTRGTTRETARLNMVSFLDQIRFAGILTTRTFSLNVLRDPEYVSGDSIHTEWLTERMSTSSFRGAGQSDRPELALAAMALIDYITEKTRRRNQFFSSLDSGQPLRPTLFANTSFTRVGYEDRVYEINVREVGEDHYHVTLGGTTTSIRFKEMQPSGGYLLTTREEIFAVFRTDDVVESHIEMGGRTYTIGTDLDPSTFRAPLAGIITEIRVEEGQVVGEGEVLLSMEAMKMITSLHSPRAGEIADITVEVGDNVDAGTVLLRFRGGGDAKGCDVGEERALVFSEEEEWSRMQGEVGELARASFRAESDHVRLVMLSEALANILAGYPQPFNIMDVLLRETLELKEQIDEKRWISGVSSLVDRFYRDEHYFRGDRSLPGGVLEAEASRQGLDLFQLARSHAFMRSKLKMLLALLDDISDMDYRSMEGQLKRLSELGYTSSYRDVVAKSEELLHLLTQKLRPSQDLDEMMEKILAAERDGRKDEMEDLLGTVMEASESLMARLVGYLLTGKSGLRKAAGKLILLRAYRRHPGLTVEYEKNRDGKRTYIWRFRDEMAGHFRAGLVSLVHPDEDVGGALTRLHERLANMWNEESDRPHGEDVMELLIPWPEGIADMNALSSHLMDELERTLAKVILKRITFVVRVKGEEYPGLLTFRRSEPNGPYKEDRLYRDVHPTLGHDMGLQELEPLKDHLANMPSGDMNVHLYHYRKPDPRGEDYPDIEDRIFVRTMIRDSNIVMGPQGPTFPSAVEAFETSLRHLRISYAATGASTHNNEIYLRFVRSIRLSWEETRRILMKMQRHIRDYADVDLTRTEIHGRVNSWLRPGESHEMLIAVDNPTGLMLELKPYVIEEHLFPGDDKPVRALIRFEELKRQMEEPGYVPPEDAYQRASDRHREMTPLDRKRKMRRSRGKVYVYDRPALLEMELRRAWNRTGKSVPKDVFGVEELAIDARGEITPVERKPGSNKHSIVVWRVSIKTPETPAGRQFILVSGDMTLKGGSVAIREDMNYVEAARLAMKEGIPFIYFAEGSGARIGLDKIVSHRLSYDAERDELFLTARDHEMLSPLVMARPAEVSSGDMGGDGGANEIRYVVTSIVGGVPGIRLDEEDGYIYLTEGDHREFGHLVRAHPVDVTRGNVPQRRWVIDGIDRSSPEINQENLSGSARMARASSLAFHSIPTMAVVTDTCTGIISYNVRLLKRVVQTRHSEIILTGYRALNALYGGEKIFSSNRELGGPGIMGPNGISHRIVEDEREASGYVISWLRGIPPKMGLSLPVALTDDPVSRDVEEDILGRRAVIERPEPEAERPHPYDAMQLAEILFDMGSTEEDMYDWGKTVRVGRAALGGIPIGFIAVETGTAVRSIPADPVDPRSSSKDRLQFGQVWYPDSSFKTAQWIEFMRREGKPLVILPNWRGFAGGKLELYEEVLKYGAMIVDELSKYDLPVILYMPPYAEIRGGAWVVIDTQINPDHIVFLVDEHATGSVLEPSGMESVPLVEREIRKDMRKNDPELASLYSERKRSTGQLDRIREIDGRIEVRESEQYPNYLKKWIRIFRKHNTAERMKEVGTAAEVVPTGRARERIYRALVRGLEKVGRGGKGG